MYRFLGVYYRSIPLGIFALEFLYFAYIHTWEVDPHHDGIMYTAAVGVFEGKIPHKDFFAQYGPVTPIIQGIWFRVTEPTLFNLKLLTSLSLALVGTLLYVAIKQRVSVLSATLISICWTLTGPFGLPWSSTFSTLCILGSLIILSKTVDIESQGNRVQMQSFLIGSILAVGTFTRIHTIFVYCAIFLGLIFLRQELKFRRISTFLSFGFFLTLGLILFSLSIPNALVPFLDQSILWAFENYAGGPQLKLSYFTNLAWIPLFGTANIMVVWLLMRTKKSKYPPPQLVILVYLSIYSGLMIFSQASRIGPETLRNPRIFAIVAGEKSQFSFNFTILILFIILFLQAIHDHRKSRQNEKTTTDRLKFMYILIGLATATQLYPFMDEYHIAFIIPIIIVVIVYSIPTKFALSPQIRALNLLILTLIPLLAINFHISAKIERNELESRTLAGMYGSWGNAKSIDQTLIYLEEELPGIKFECADGIYAGAGGRYLSIDEKFVNWGPPNKLQDSYNRKFLCYVDQATVNTYQTSGWRVKFQVPLGLGSGYSKVSSWNVLLERFTFDLRKGITN